MTVTPGRKLLSQNHPNEANKMSSGRLAMAPRRITFAMPPAQSGNPVLTILGMIRFDGFLEGPLWVKNFLLTPSWGLVGHELQACDHGYCCMFMSDQQ